MQADAILETKLYRLAKLEIQKIRQELAEKRKAAAKLRAILKSDTKLWNLVKTELNEVAEKFADSRRTRISDDDITEEFSAESFIVEEDAVVLVTRDGWVKRQRSINLETTRMREGDEPLALVGGSTRQCLIVFTNMGSAYVCRINDVPASSGHGSPVQKLFKFRDGERVVAAMGTDPRVMPEFAHEKPDLDDDYEDPYPHVLSVTKKGYSQRFTLWSHREPSTSRGRMFARLAKGDEVVAAFKVYAEDAVCAVTKKGKALCCIAQDVNLLSGRGQGRDLHQGRFRRRGGRGLPRRDAGRARQDLGRQAEVVGGRPRGDLARGQGGAQSSSAGRSRRCTCRHPMCPT